MNQNTERRLIKCKDLLMHRAKKKPTAYAALAQIMNFELEILPNLAIFFALIMTLFALPVQSEEHRTGKVVAKRESLVQVHLTDGAGQVKTGDKVRFETEIAGFTVQAGKGEVLSLVGNDVWVTVLSGEPGLHVSALISINTLHTSSPLLSNPDNSKLAINDETPIIQEDTNRKIGNQQFCQQLRLVINDAPNTFSAYKISNKYSGATFASTMKIVGAENCHIEVSLFLASHICRWHVQDKTDSSRIFTELEAEATACLGDSVLNLTTVKKSKHTTKVLSLNKKNISLQLTEGVRPSLPNEHQSSKVWLEVEYRRGLDNWN